MNKSQAITSAFAQMGSALVVGEVEYAKVHNWLVDCFDKKRSERERQLSLESPQDIVALIADWAYAKDMEHILDQMTPEKRAKQELFTPEEYERLVDQEIGIKAGIKVTDEFDDHGPVFRQALNKQLQEAIAKWEDTLAFTERSGVTEDEFEPSDLYSLCEVRDELEYAKWGIEIFQISGRLKDLPYYQEYRKRLQELDIRFRKVLEGKTLPRPYADKVFWWRQRNGAK